MRIKESMRLRIGTEVKFYRGDMQLTGGGVWKSAICAYNIPDWTITFDQRPSDLVQGDIIRWADGAERLVIGVEGVTVAYSEPVVPISGD